MKYWVFEFENMWRSYSIYITFQKSRANKKLCLFSKQGRIFLHSYWFLYCLSFNYVWEYVCKMLSSTQLTFTCLKPTIANTKKRCKICSRLTMKILEQRKVALVFLSLTLNIFDTFNALIFKFYAWIVNNSKGGLTYYVFLILSLALVYNTTSPYFCPS